MKTKMIPVIIMLIAGSITSVITYILHYPLKTMLWVLLVVLLLFYAIGCGVQTVIELFERENAQKEAEEEKETLPGEGAVVEKEMTPDDEEAAEKESMQEA
jgi:predicted RND superfamily exporter protein